MALPRKLKNLNLFNDGNSYIGQIVEFTLPKLTRTMEEYRAAGMNAPIKIDMGQEIIETEWKCGGLMREVLAQYAIAVHNGVQLRFAGAYQRDDTGEVDSVEIVIRGRHEEVDPGNAKPGDNTEFSVKTVASYYKLSINGRVMHEFDIVNMIEIVDGVDRLAEQRRAIGG